jgi:hypothetical protein
MIEISKGHLENLQITDLPVLRAEILFTAICFLNQIEIKKLILQGFNTIYMI